ncbi:GntR family transcriptional regulator [uncultured Bradyrhizobium sp.]|uniref:GntR family transcriptional regulator n=1 Tax=uncultured Bradyrhizobium sp. TaxID=199684 RepID=UPI0035C9FA25
MQSPDRSLSKRRAKVYPALREMCLDYRFWPRQQLHIEELAGVLSSSATPVREALARLAGEGLIEAVPNRGYVAKTLSEDEMRGSLDLLFTLLKESITRSPPERWISGMGGRPSELPEDADATFSFVNDTFTLIAQLSDNEVLFEHILRLIELTRFVRRLDMEDPNAVAMTRRSVIGLRENLAAGDSCSALQNLHEQNRDVQQRLAHVVKEGRARSISQKRSLTPRMSTA